MMRNWKARAICKNSPNLFPFHPNELIRVPLLARYDKDASRYHKAVYQRKRTDLLNVIDSVLSPLFLGQLKNLHKSVLSAYKKEMVEGIRGEGYNFAEICGKAQEACEKRFVTGATEAKLEDTDWVWEDELELLREEISSVSDHFRADETKKMINSIEVSSFITFLWGRGSKRLIIFFSHSAISRNRSQNLSNCTSIPLQQTCGTRCLQPLLRLLIRLKPRTWARLGVSLRFIRLIG